MKSLITIICLISCMATTYAQTPLHCGVKASWILSQHYAPPLIESDSEVVSGRRNGFNGGLYLDMEKLPNLDLSYELLWMSKGSREKITGIEDAEEDDLKLVKRDGKWLVHLTAK